MTSAFSWQNSVSLCPASFCTPRPNFPVTTGTTKVHLVKAMVFPVVMYGYESWAVKKAQR